MNHLMNHMMNRMHVERPGMYSVLQDLGRYGHQQYGVPVNGPMDEWSHRVANALVGNAEDAAVLECTLTGPVVSFSEDTLIALSGARMHVTVAGLPVPYNRAVLVRRRVALEFGQPVSGARTYLAVRGGFGVEPVLGSRSTNGRGVFGGFAGRALRKGDAVPLALPLRGEPMSPLARLMVQSGLPMISAPSIDAESPSMALDRLRFIPGPQWKMFKADALRHFTSGPYIVSSQSDRMGYRLEGAALALRRPLEMISEATSFGTIQVPPNGQPIILMADRQSAGGYPKIGYVVSADLPALAQALPGDVLHFVATTQEEAEKSWRHFEDRLQQLRAAAALALQ
jgi:biotin-dependent carboxylase-like uncharacterized protein